MSVQLAILTNIVSPHMMPLARSLVTLLGEAHVRYIAREGMHEERRTLGWDADLNPEWVINPRMSLQAEAAADACCREAPVLLCGYRDLSLLEARAAKGLHSYYFSERWFKPPHGAWRLLHPKYLRMAWRLVRMLKSGRVTYLPIGLYAASDMLRLVGLLGVSPWRSLMPVSALVESPAKPMAAFQTPATDWMRLWGYFVEPAGPPPPSPSGPGRGVLNPSRPGGPQRRSGAEPLRLLWLGRMLDWKRGETLIRAVTALLGDGRALQLIFLGYGPEEPRWRQLAGQHLVHNVELALDAEGRVDSSLSGVFFQKPVPIAHVRLWLRAVDVLTLTSDGAEGWGAVVSEAMAEGVCVIASRQAGSSGTVIQHGVTGLLFDAGNANQLKEQILVCMGPERQLAGRAGRRDHEQHWAPDVAARAFLQHARHLLAEEPKSAR